MKTIGITGGAGSGKSEVLKLLETGFGAHVIIADDVARRLSAKGGESYQKIVRTFGTDILGDDGEIDRGRLAQVVFADADKRARLNSITHPDVQRAILSEIEAVKAQGTAACIVVEAALLLEAGYKPLLDELWFVHTDADIRRERMKTTRNYSDEKIDGILKSQLSDAEFMAGCDMMIENNTTLEAVEAQLQDIFSKIN